MRKSGWLAGGDALAILILSVSGYLTHYAGKEAFSFRWLSTFLPFCLGWAAAAGLAGLFTPAVAGRWKSAFWRAGLAALLAAPFATMLRGVYLNAAVSPVFMLVLSATATLAMALWRGVWAWLAEKRQWYG